MSYFDWAATTSISKNALKAYEDIALNYPANPSSSHSQGQKAALKLAECRKKIADILHTESNFIYFTSGGTESNSIILNSLLLSPSSCEVITTGIEHPAILEHKAFLVSKGFKFTTLSCNEGYLNVQKLKEALNPNVRLVCIMAVNNVTGTVQNIKEAVKVIREYSETVNRKIHIHCDAVQAAGKMEFYPQELDLDSASFSSHKFYGPRGIGILYNRNNNLHSISKGGGQEKGLRPGTENLAAIASMTVALEEEYSSIKEHSDYVLKLRNKIEKSLLNEGFALISPSSSDEKEFSPYIICLSTQGIPSEVFLRVMDDKGFCLSSSSACSSNSRGKAESVLAQMNVDPKTRMYAIRISLSHLNTEEETDNLINTMIEVKKELSYGKY